MLTLTKELIVGHPLIDADHQKLIDIINEFEEHSKSLKNEQLMKDTIKALHAYGVEHFAREEKIQRECMYPHHETHCLEHKKLLKAVKDTAKAYFVEKTRLLNGESIKELNTFLMAWLIDHVKGFDVNMRTWVSLEETDDDESSVPALYKFSKEMCILVIDADPTFRAKLVDLLKSMEAATILEAEDSLTGLKMAFGDPRPDIVFCDLKTGPIDGLAVSGALQSSWETPINWIPVVILSTDHEVMLTRKAFAAGAIGTFSKDTNLKDLSKFLCLATKQQKPEDPSAASQEQVAKRLGTSSAKS